METESLNLRDRAKRAYEVGRVLRAAAWSIPTLLLGAGVALLVHEVSVPLLLAAALYAVSVFLLWWGRAPGKGVLPGITYGLLPLAAGVVAKLHGHVCMGFACYTSCMLFCVGGGVIAGLLTARLAARSKSPLAVFLSGASMALFTGAIGGGCVGLHGIVGMGLGIAVGIVPMMLFRRPRHE